MAATEKEIREKLAGFFGSPASTLIAVVKSVDKTERTCVLSDEEIDYFDVRLQPVTGGTTGGVIFPKIGCVAIAVKIEDTDEWVLIGASEYESIEISIDNLKINGGNLGGLLKIDKMIEWMGKVYADLQMLKTQLNTWPVAGNSAPLALVFNVTVPNPVKSDFEDTKITH